MGRRARGAVPDLIEALDDPEAGVVRKAVWALGEIGPGAEAAVPKLIEPPSRSWSSWESRSGIANPSGGRSGESAAGSDYAYAP
jgi:hypothetical protein